MNVSDGDEELTVGDEEQSFLVVLIFYNFYRLNVAVKIEALKEKCPSTAASEGQTAPMIKLLYIYN